MEFAAGAIVYKIQSNNPLYLLILAGDNDCWGFPKGHPEGNESTEETALREVYEETANKISLINGFKYVMQYVLPSGEEKTTTIFVGQSITEDPLVIPNKEIADKQWFSYEEAVRTLSFDNQKEVLQKAHEFIRRKIC